MIKNILKKTAFALAVVASTMMVANIASAHDFGNNKGGRGNGPVIYVPGQGLFYDSIVLKDLPFEGVFQKLEAAGPSGLQTEFGLGDTGYLGGRWWMDDGNGTMGPEDHYFLCPLLGPGREEE